MNIFRVTTILLIAFATCLTGAAQESTTGLREREIDFQNDNSTPLMILHKPKPAYPKPETGTVCISGTVRLRIEFKSDATIGDIWILKGMSHGATENAIEAARKIVFVPASVDGEAQTIKRTVVFNFGIY